MRNLTIYLAVTACLFATKMAAQESFNERVKVIASKIEQVSISEKEALKKEVESVNVELENGTVSGKEADEKKLAFAEKRARNIEEKVAVYEEELKDIIQQKVDGKFVDKKFKLDTLSVNGRDLPIVYEVIDSTEINFKKKKIYLSWSNWEKDVKKRDSIQNLTSERRTTSQFVFAAGVNNLVTDGAVANSDFRYMGSHFYEWGTAWNTRLAKNNNLLHLKYGLSFQYNNLRPTDNRFFVDNGKETNLETAAVHMKDSRFRNLNIVVPVHLEFDFTPKREHDGKQIFKTHKTFRFGIGGYAGFNVKSKQIAKYEIDGYKKKEVTKGNFNVNDFIYGVSAYFGYRETSIYVKYDLNPMFKDNAIEQNNISLGVRFDFN